MKKVAFLLLLLLPLSTGCWDRLQLRNLHLVDIAGFDQNEESGDAELYFIVTKLKSAGQGNGEPNSVITELRGPSVVEAVGTGEYNDQAPFLGISTRLYMISEKFASLDPVGELAFLLHAPYSSINTPLVIFEGELSKFLETKSKTNKEFTKDLNEFVISMEKNGKMPTVSVMNFIQSRDEPLEDLALPVIRETKSGVELGGVQLFRNGSNTRTKLNNEQLQMLMMLRRNEIYRQKFAGNFYEKSEKDSDKTKKINYGFSIKKKKTKITYSKNKNSLPKVIINVKLQINIFDISGGKTFKPNYVNQVEKELSRHLEQIALDTIKTMQNANSDVLGIGKELKAFHPNIWNSLSWRKDYPRMSIEPNFNVQILNAHE